MAEMLWMLYSWWKNAGVGTRKRRKRGGGRMEIQEACRFTVNEFEVGDMVHCCRRRLY
jgi:hypothetical protein